MVAFILWFNWLCISPITFLRSTELNSHLINSLILRFTSFVSNRDHWVRVANTSIQVINIKYCMPKIYLLPKFYCISDFFFCITPSPYTLLTQSNRETLKLKCFMRYSFPLLKTTILLLLGYLTHATLSVNKMSSGITRLLVTCLLPVLVVILWWPYIFGSIKEMKYLILEFQSRKNIIKN